MSAARSYYSSPIKDFLKLRDDEILGILLTSEEFDTNDLQKAAWRQEISILKNLLVPFSSGDVIFEFTIPRIGHRVDVILLIEGIIFFWNLKLGRTDTIRMLMIK